MNLEKAKFYTKKFEGLSFHPYLCPTGHLTIGYGHNLEKWNNRGNSLLLVGQ